jgi:ribosome-binding protein aMBF1 (putative translation factor)
MKTLRSATSRAVANVIAGARKERELSQRELSSLLKRPHSVIGMIESYQRQVNVAEFIAIAEALRLDPLDLFRRVLRERRAP